MLHEFVLRYDIIRLFILHLFLVSVGRTERSALRALREQLFVHKSELIGAFQEYDPENTGAKADKTNAVNR